MQSLGRFNYYEILELKTNAPQHEVTKAYERARVTYTGENPAIYTIFSELEARELMTVIEEAYSILGNKTLRQIYDQRLLSGRATHEDLSFNAIINASKAMILESKPKERKPKYLRDEAFDKEIKTKTDWDGDFLRRVREYKGYAPEQIFEITKINPCYVSAIESMNSSELPAAVFVRGYVIQIAKTLGLDSKTVADSYMKLYKQKIAV